MIETIIEAVARHAMDRPDAQALTDGSTSLSWSEVSAWITDAAGWLLDLGLPRGASVLGWLPNGLEWYLIRLACEQAGFFWVPVPTSQGKRELASILERTRPSVLVTKEHFRDHDYKVEADELCVQLGLDPLHITAPDEGLLRLAGRPKASSQPLRLDEPAHALATSGSEGTPKLAIYTLMAACRRAHAQAQLLKLTAGDKILVLSPGTGPARVGWLAAPIAGSCVTAMPRFGTRAAMELIQSMGVTIVCGTPAQLAMLVPKLGEADTSSVRIWYAVGSVMPPTLGQDLESQTKGIVISNYGGSDFGGWAAPDIDAAPAVRHRTVGRPQGDTEFRIVDDQCSDLPAGQVGELIGRGPCSISGFLGEEGRQAWRDGWFHTGDLASMDGDGNLVIVGRLKEVIVRGGDKVSPVEIEALLRTHNSVAQVAVIGVPDSVLGERICAFVVVTPGQDPPTLESLRGYLEDQGLAHYKTPERLVVLGSMPIVGDKIDRRALAAIAAG